MAGTADPAYAVPDVESEVFVAAASALENLYPELKLSSDVLGRYFNLLQLPEQSLRDAGLIASSEEIYGGSDTEHVPVAVEVQASNNVSDAVKGIDDPYVYVENSAPSTVAEEKEEGIVCRGPIGEFLLKNDIDLSPAQIGILMYVFGTSPMFFVEKEMITETSLEAYKNPGVRTEVFYFKRNVGQSPISYESRGLLGAGVSHYLHHRRPQFFNFGIQRAFQNALSPHRYRPSHLHTPPPVHGWGPHGPPSHHNPGGPFYGEWGHHGPQGHYGGHHGSHFEGHYGGNQGGHYGGHQGGHYGGHQGGHYGGHHGGHYGGHHEGHHGGHHGGHH